MFHHGTFRVNPKRGFKDNAIILRKYHLILIFDDFIGNQEPRHAQNIDKRRPANIFI